MQCLARSQYLVNGSQKKKGRRQSLSLAEDKYSKEWTIRRQRRVCVSDAEREIALPQDEELFENKEDLRHLNIPPCSLFPYPDHFPICIGDKKIGKKLEWDGSNRNADL